MSEKLKIEELIGPTINSLGYDLVRVQILDEGTKTLQIMVDRLDEANLTIDDCSIISKEISVIIDINDPIGENYLLEVSSPGIDRPLLRFKDFEKYAGFHARVDMNTALEGRKKFKGKLIGTEGNNIRIKVKEETYLLPFSKIEKAKLTLTQELLDAAIQN
jgi:ribosome maturation factor RimP